MEPSLPVLRTNHSSNCITNLMTKHLQVNAALSQERSTVESLRSEVGRAKQQLLDATNASAALSARLAEAEKAAAASKAELEQVGGGWVSEG